MELITNYVNYLLITKYGMKRDIYLAKEFQKEGGNVFFYTYSNGKEIRTISCFFSKGNYRIYTEKYPDWLYEKTNE